MNSFTLRNYYTSKYLSKYKEPYKTQSKDLEIFMIRNLLRNYSEFTILEAVDRFIKESSKDKARITYFASNKVFPYKNKDLILLDKVTKYYRIFPFYSTEDKQKVRRLLKEYLDYALSYSLSEEDINRKASILSELESLKSV
jgi:hypothetical protein